MSVYDEFAQLGIDFSELTKWAEEAKECNCCRAWAKLDENGHCFNCSPEPHEHAQITIIMDIGHEFDK